MPVNTSVPLIYRLLFLYIEPVAALGGTLITTFDPVSFLRTFSPASTSSIYSPLTQPIYDQVAALLFLFAWIQAVVLRSTDDIRLWKTILFGMFLCDVLHLYSSYKILGPEMFFDPRMWRAEEWVNFGMLYGPGGLRLAFCAGFGLKGEEKVVKSQ